MKSLLLAFYVLYSTIQQPSTGNEIDLHLWIDNYWNDSQHQETQLLLQYGTVYINGQKAQSGDTVHEGDRIEAKEKTQAALVFFDDSVTRLKPNTTILIKKLDTSDYEIGKGAIVLKIEDGEAWSKVPKYTDPDFSFEVETATVNATIRGSSLNVYTDGNCQSVVSAIEHTTTVNPLQNAFEKQEIIEGENVQIFHSEACLEDTETENIIEKNRITKEAFESEWFTENHQADQNFEKTLVKKEKARVESALQAFPVFDSFHTVLQISQLNQEQKARLEFAMAQKEMLSAYKALEKNDDLQANEHIQKAERFIKNNQNILPKIYQQKLMQKSERLLRTALPDENRYTLMDFIYQQEIKTLSQEQSSNIRKHQAHRKILDYYDLLKKNKAPLEKSHIEKLRNYLSTTMQEEPKNHFVKQIMTDPYLKKIVKTKMQFTESPETDNRDVIDPEVMVFFGESLTNSKTLQEVIQTIEAEQLEAQAETKPIPEPIVTPPTLPIVPEPEPLPTVPEITEPEPEPTIIPEFDAGEEVSIMPDIPEYSSEDPAYNPIVKEPENPTIPYIPEEPPAVDQPPQESTAGKLYISKKSSLPNKITTSAGAQNKTVHALELKSEGGSVKLTALQFRRVGRGNANDFDQVWLESNGNVISPKIRPTKDLITISLNSPITISGTKDITVKANISDRVESMNSRLTLFLPEWVGANTKNKIGFFPIGGSSVLVGDQD